VGFRMEFKTDNGVLEYDLMDGETLYDRVVEEFDLDGEYEDEMKKSLEDFKEFCLAIKGEFYYVSVIHTPVGGFFKFFKEIKDLLDLPIMGVAYPLCVGEYKINFNGINRSSRTTKLLRLYERFGFSEVHSIPREYADDALSIVFK